jgi:hypothetical protein
MNVFRLTTIVTKTQTAKALTDLSCALVTLDTVEMGRLPKANLRQHLQFTKVLLSKN